MYYLFLSFCNKYTTETGECQLLFYTKIRGRNCAKCIKYKNRVAGASERRAEKEKRAGNTLRERLIFGKVVAKPTHYAVARLGGLSLPSIIIIPH